MTSSKTTLAFLIYGLLVQCNVCSPLSYPNIRMESAGFDEEGHSLTDLTFDSDQITIRSSPSVTEDAYTFYSPPSKRLERHADGMFNKAYRKALGQLSARKYLHTLMAKRVGGGSMIEDDNEPLSKRHSDGVFTDSYSHYRKQMAVKKYLAAVLGKRGPSDSVWKREASDASDPVSRKSSTGLEVNRSDKHVSVRGILGHLPFCRVRKNPCRHCGKINTSQSEHQ